MKDLKEKLIVLRDMLQHRGNKTFHFFSELISKIDQEEDEVVTTILRSYALVQYSDFNFDEEKIFDEVWNLAKRHEKEQ